MSSSENQQIKHETSSQCPDCKKKYDVSSQEEEEQGNQRIIIPIRKDMLNGHNSQTERMLKNLQIEIQNLKHSNAQKDKMIDDLKKDMQHKMTHYMFYGELHKQADEINKLKSQMSGSNLRYSRKNQINEQQVRQIFREQSRRIAYEPKQNYGQRHRSQRNTHLRQKCHSTHDNYSKLRKQFLKQLKQQVSKPQKTIKTKLRAQPDVTKEYFQSEIKVKQIFNIKDAKRKIKQLEQRIKVYEIEMLWMSNFVSTFIKTMQNIAYKKYSQQIIIPQWCLKKKAKTCWRYMKHLFEFLYSEPQN